MALSGSSTVILKCGERIGRTPSMAVFRYALNAFVVSFSRCRKRARINPLASAVQDEFCEGIINDTASANEATSKDTIVAFLKLLPVTNHVAAVVGVIGHHDDGRIATHRI